MDICFGLCVDRLLKEFHNVYLMIVHTGAVAPIPNFSLGLP
jgi:hypothetical protein